MANYGKMGRRRLRIRPSSALLLLALSTLPSWVAADGIITDIFQYATDRLFPPEEYIDPDSSIKSLNIVQISEMRPRDIRRRLGRTHGYEPGELARMIDKKELINALSYEEHKFYEQEMDRRKWIMVKRTIIYTTLAIMAVMFWPLIKHAVEVALVRLEMYRDRRKYEIKRCNDYESRVGHFGICLLFIIDFLSLWMSMSILLSWFVTRSKYFFPTPSIPLRPAQLLSPGGDAGALGKYGINLGPMLVSWIFRYLNGKVEHMIGRDCAKQLRKKQKKDKEDLKRARKEARRQAREEERRRRQEFGETSSDDDDVRDDFDDEVWSGMTPSSNGDRSFNQPSEEDIYREADRLAGRLGDID